MSFTLLTLPQVALRAGTVPDEGSLSLEYVPSTEYVADSKGADAPGTLVFHIGLHSYSLGSGTPVKLVLSQDGKRTYLFDATGSEKQRCAVHLVIPAPTEDVIHIAQDVETFDQLLSQYTEFSWSYDSPKDAPPPLPPRSPRPSTPLPDSHEHQANIKANAEEGKPIEDPALRGRLVLMDASNGDIVGELPNAMDFHEDPKLLSDSKASDAVVLEMQPEMYDACTGAKEMGLIGEDLREAREVIVCAVPPEEQDWVMKSATIVSQAISGSTSLLLAGITSASNYYIAHSSPGAPKPASGSSSPRPPPSPSSPPSALSTAHTVSDKARAASAKTADMVGNIITRAMGGKSTVPPIPPSTIVMETPPPYTVYAPKRKPRLPPRVQPEKDADDAPRGPPGVTLRLLMSANLLLTTVDDSARRVLEVSTDRLGAVVGHKYGPEAQRSTHLASYTARNVVLVYVDVRGFARRALLKKAGKEFVKARVSGNKSQSPSADASAKS